MEHYTYTKHRRTHPRYRARAQQPSTKQIFTHASCISRCRDYDLTTRILFVFVMVCSGFFLVIALGQFPTLLSAADTASSGTSSPKSTPKTQWHKGSMPYLYQTDMQWASDPYAGSTVAESGCGPTCLTMVYIYTTGNTDMDPAKMARFSEISGFVDDGKTSWQFMSEGANHMGLTSEELPAQEQRILSVLESGRPIIASVSKGDFTTSGHFIVLCGIDTKGKIVIRDPNSPERSDSTWSLKRILNQTRNLWAFSRA